MDFLMNIALTKPTGFWSTIIFGIDSFVKNYAIVMILITIAIRVVMMPFEFINKLSTKNMSRKQAEMKPELDKVNKQFANNKDMLNQKTMEVYKKHNFNMVGTCGIMLGYLIITMVVFFTLFGNLNTISSYKIAEEYVTVSDAYYETYEGIYNEYHSTTSSDSVEYEDNVRNWVNSYLLKSEEEGLATNPTIYNALIELKPTAEANANKAYDNVKTGFLWIKSIWCSDAMWSSPTLSYKDFINNTKIDSATLPEAEYNLVMTSVIREHSGMNGFFILAILSVITQYASIRFNGFLTRKKAEKQGIPLAEDPNANKSMSIIMPVIMGIFSLFYNAAFGIYLVASAIVTMLTGTVTTIIVDNLDVTKFKKNKDKNRASYSRKN